MPSSYSQTVKLYGPNWSAYTRTARLTLIEKNVDYALIEVDFSSGVMPVEHQDLHPFAKVPVLCHGDFQLYETTAIGRYIDSAFDGPNLQPDNAQSLGRMAQIIAVIDAYLSEPIRMGFVSECLIHPMLGVATDHVRVKDARNEILHGFQALGECIDGEHFLAGDQLSLADLHAAPLFDYLALSPGGEELIHSHARLRQWWTAFKSRPSLQNTTPDLTVFQAGH